MEGDNIYITIINIKWCNYLPKSDVMEQKIELVRQMVQDWNPQVARQKVRSKHTWRRTIEKKED